MTNGLFPETIYFCTYINIALPLKQSTVLKRIVSIVVIIFQVGLTLMTSFIMYMVLAVLDYQGGIDNFIGLALFHPILAILFSLLTVVVCGLPGLFIRLNHKLNIWWRTHFYFSILTGFIGFLACIMSFMPGFAEDLIYQSDGMDMVKTVPNTMLFIFGWFMLAFGILHTYPPKYIQDKLERFIAKRPVLQTSRQ